VKLFISPHNDDAVLFGAFTLMRDRPVVMTVLDSYVQLRRGHAEADVFLRRAEDIAAITGVLNRPVLFGGVSDDQPLEKMAEEIRQVFREVGPVQEAWLPLWEDGGHDHHNLVATIGRQEFAVHNIHWYLTYTAAGKSTGGVRVMCSGQMVRKKLEALACYKSQLDIDALGCYPHFLRDQTEYLQK
jgi:LmbE family N-acetylglucosaminyl deacetylase